MFVKFKSKYFASQVILTEILVQPLNFFANDYQSGSYRMEGIKTN